MEIIADSMSGSVFVTSYFIILILSRPRRLRKRALGRKVRKYFVKARRQDNLANRIEIALQDFNAYAQERFSDLKDTLFCLRARIGMWAETKNTRNHGYRVKRAVDSIDDCFEGMSEPLYGFRTKITFEKACGSFGIACNNSEDKNRFQKRQTGEKFKSDAPLDCRTINQCKT